MTAPTGPRTAQVSHGADGTAPRIALRVLATSDIHGHILPWDDLADRPAPCRGLANVASLIAEARAEVTQCLLLDNGDFLNGSPLADYVAEMRKPGPDAPHPVIAAMNALGYDAATLGNHEFSQGLPFLRCALSAAGFPVVSANLHRRLPSGKRRAFLPRFTLLHRRLCDDRGAVHDLTLGIIGFLPPQTTAWERAHVQGQLEAEAILSAARACVPRVRRAGADLVIALAHSGLGGPEAPDGAENVALRLAALPGIDAVIAGHSHQLYPAPADPIESPDAGLWSQLPDCPVLMPGFFGSHLGVMDLEVQRTADGWRVADHCCKLRPVARRHGHQGVVQSLVQPVQAILDLAAPDHAAMTRRAGMPVAHSSAPLHSYFALIGQSPIQNLLAAAQIDHMTRMLHTTPYGQLPLLAAIAPFKAGGRGGPDNYTAIPAGPLSVRNIADLYIHPNRPVALCLNGSEIAQWLERSVSLFQRVAPGAVDAPLINLDFPAHNFDMLHGLNYEVDLSQPARFDASGNVINAKARRIVNLTYRGRPVGADARFVVATNSYRASGGAGFAGTDAAHTILEDPRPLRHILERYVMVTGQIEDQPGPTWRFSHCPGTSAVFDSSPAGAELATTLGLQVVAPQPSGFLRFRLRL